MRHTDEFEQRLAKAKSELPHFFLIDTPVDMENVKYDADKQQLLVSIYALQNYSLQSSELMSALGLFSELYSNGIETDYSMLDNILWAYKREDRNVGTYVGSNAFGTRTTVYKQQSESRGIFERSARYKESVWSVAEGRYDGPFSMLAFQLNMSPDQARQTKSAGVAAAVLAFPRYPFYAKGQDSFSPTRAAPYDRTTDVYIILADIQAVVLYDKQGNILGIRATR